jgi:hypothetical protein
MTGERFKRYIGKLYYDEEGTGANQDSINTAVNILRAEAEYRSQTIPLSLRVTWLDSNTEQEIYYDMTNERRQCIKITTDGWQLVESTDLPRPLFRRFKQTAQVLPIKDYDPDMRDKFLSLMNLKREDDKVLLIVYMTCGFIAIICFYICRQYNIILPIAFNGDQFRIV